MLIFAKALTRTATTYLRSCGRSALPSWTYFKKVLDARAAALGRKLSRHIQEACD